jgi:hypothetical protein
MGAGKIPFALVDREGDQLWKGEPIDAVRGSTGSPRTVFLRRFQIKMLEF